MQWMILPYRRYAEFGGRSRRLEYWSFVLFNTLVYVAFNVVFGDHVVARNSFGFHVGTNVTGIPGLVLAILEVAAFIPNLAVSVRRLHDQDRSGWLLLLALIPVLGWFALLVLDCLDGTRGPNRYGPDPKHPFDVDAFS